jgi:stalled ribosome rescue protein Dom34
MPRRGRRGYPTAILVGLNKEATNIWLVYSESIKQGVNILRQEDDKTSYKYNEEIIRSIKKLLIDGFNQLLIVSPKKTGLLDHINKSHGWLTKKLTVREIQGRASKVSDVINLAKNNIIQDAVNQVAVEVDARIIEQLEKALNNDSVIFTVKELLDIIRTERTPKFIVASERFDAEWRENRRYQSLIQKAKNAGAIFTILKRNSLGYVRVEQLGGFVCIIR